MALRWSSVVNLNSQGGITMKSDDRKPTTTRCRDPRSQRRALAHRGARRADPAAGPLPHRADGQLQPGADPGAPAPREGRRGLRTLRGDQGRQRLHQGRGVPAGHEDGHVDPVLHGGRRARQPRHLARPARLRAEVLHQRGQLRHGGQQHARCSSCATP